MIPQTGGRFLTPEDKLSSGKKAITAFLLGILFMFVALIVQSVFQVAPLFIFAEIHGSGITASAKAYSILERNNFIIFSIYLGAIAGILQETAKYVAVDTRNKFLTIFIGLGFAAVDIIDLLLLNIIAGAAYAGLLMILSVLNIIFSILFHTGTAAFLKSGLISGSGRVYLAVCIILHSAVDGGLVGADYLVFFHPGSSLAIKIIYWALTLLTGVIIFTVGVIKLKRSMEERQPSEAIVF
ncbi:MAG: hypothetical protein QW597_04690 [Thermoplasmataceae archaeon]